MAIIEVNCPSCSQRLTCDPRDLEEPVRCPRCGRESRPVDLLDPDEPVPAIPAKRGKGKGTLVWGSGAPPTEPADERPSPGRGAAGRGGPQRTRAARTGTERGGTVVLRSPEEEQAETDEEQAAAQAEEPVLAEEKPVLAEEQPVLAGEEPVLAGEEPVLAEEEPVLAEEEPAPRPEPAAAAPAPPAAPPAGPVPRAIPAPRPPPSRRAKRKTTIAELSGVAQKLSVTTTTKVPSRATRQILVASGAGLTMVVLAAMALAAGSWRWLLGVVAFFALSGLLTWVGLKTLPRLAARWGEIELPGHAWMWLTGGVSFVAGVAAVLTWGVSAATVSLAGGLPIFGTPNVTAPVASLAPADEGLKRQGHVGMAGGVLFVPPSFHSDDGSFDLLLHFHGNPDLVEESVTKVGLNAVVHITNLGVDSSPYEQAFVAPQAFDGLVGKIVERMGKLGLRDPRVRRIAISTWSAGYGGLFHILRDPGRFERIDALLLLDGLHFRYEDEVKGKVSPLAMEPFVRYAREAAEGRKLFWLTHSQVQTTGYANTTQTADHLLAALGMTRRNVDAATASPPKVRLDVAVRAFPREAQRWLVARTMAEKGNFRVLGYAGHLREDHMAHLIQMSVTVLPALAERWR